MPNRVIREGILECDKVNMLTPQAEVFFRRLMNVADDLGLFDGRLPILLARLYPLKYGQITEEQIMDWTEECVKMGLLIEYEAEGMPYLCIPKFNQQVRIKKPKYPYPPEDVLREHEDLEMLLTYGGGVNPDSPATDNPEKLHEYHRQQLFSEKGNEDILNIGKQLNYTVSNPHWAEIFNAHLQTQGKVHNEYRSWLRHFRFWLEKRLPDLKQADQQNAAGKSRTYLN